MATPDPNTAAPIAQTPPAATPVAAPDVAPAAAPPLPAGTGANVDATMAQAAPFVKAAETATQQATASASQDTTPAPQPHAKLLAMIQGLGIGLSSFGTAMGTKGKEGGAPEVQQFYANKQQQKIQAQTAAREQQNATTQRYMTIADTNMKTANNIMLLHTMPTDMALKDTELATKKQELATGKTSSDIQVAEFMKQNWGLSPEQVAGSAATTPQALSNSKSMLDRSVNGPTGAIQILGKDNPAVIAAQKVAASPNPSVSDIMSAGQGLSVALGQQKEVTAAQTAKEAAAANSPVAKLSTPEALATPGAAQAIQAKIDDPNTAAADIPRLQALIPRAKLAQTNALAFEAAKARQTEAITNGDPKAAGALLQSGLVSPQELISSRKPEFAQQAFDEAIRLGGGVKGPDGKWTGGNWSAVGAESQYEYAKNPKTQNTLNLLSTMQAPNGSIDIAKKQFATIPDKINEDTFNKIMNGTLTEVGQTPVTNFKAAMTSLADEYAQVLQGGAATETTLNQAKDLIKAAYSKEQGAGAFDVISQDMAARQKGMIRDNPALMKMYPQAGTQPAVQPPPGATHEVKDAQGKHTGWRMPDGTISRQ